LFLLTIVVAAQFAPSRWPSSDFIVPDSHRSQIRAV
jgi:hypothetical protein